MRQAVGAQLVQETERLRAGLGLVDRQIIVVLSKLAPAAIEALLDSLTRREPSVARTILNAALDASQHFDQLVTEFGKTETPIRTLAREACRAPGPRTAGRKFIKDRQVVMERLTRRGTDVTVARTIVSIAYVAADPIAKGDELFAHFEAAVRLTKAVHPHAARSIALSACRLLDPMAAARRYVDNYDRIVEMVSRIDARHAHFVAAQAFRSDQPLRWARRYLGERKRRTAARS